MKISLSKTKKIVIFLILLSFLFNFSIILAQEEFIEETQIGNIFNLPKENFVVKNVILTQEQGNLTLFIRSGGYIKIKIIARENNQVKEIDYIYDNLRYGKVIVSQQAIPIFANLESTGNFTYNFPGLEPVQVTSPARIYFNEGKLTLVPSSFENKITPLAFDIFFNGKTYTIKSSENVNFFLNSLYGNEFELNDLKIRKGKITIAEDGYFLEKGEVIYKNILTGVTGLTDKILIVDSNKDIGSFNENCLKISNSVLEAKSKEKEVLFLKVLPGNLVFNTNKFKYEEGKKSKVPDEFDSLSITLYNGGEIKVKNREQENLIPLVETKSVQEGLIRVNNGRSSIEAINNEFKN
ncbi:MAG: hypothetical protein QXP53_02640 [Candidatus Pacearchaeota archaeon]